MTKLFLTINTFVITEGSENQWIYQWICAIQMIWKLSNFAKDHCFWTLWTLNYVDFIPFSCIISKSCSWVSKKHDWTSNFVVGVIKSVLSICPSVCISVMHFPQDLVCRFVKFFAWEYFVIYTKKWQSDNLFVV